MVKQLLKVRLYIESVRFSWSSHVCWPYVGSAILQHGLVRLGGGALVVVGLAVRV